MGDPIDDFTDKLTPPLEMTSDQWDSVRGIAVYIQNELKCDYHKALVIAYFRWHNVNDAESLKH